MPASDESGFGGAVDGPYIDGFAITKSDTVDNARVCNAIWVGTAGDGVLNVVTVRGTVLALTSVPAGLLRIRAKRINTGGTTANLIGLI